MSHDEGPRLSWAQKHGFAPLPPMLKLGDPVPDALINEVWNVLAREVLTQDFGDPGSYRPKRIQFLARWAAVDESVIPYHDYEVREWARRVLNGRPKAYAIYDLVEACLEEWSSIVPGLPAQVDHVLKAHGAPVRVVGGRLAPITDAREIEAIEEAHRALASSTHRHAATHLAKAVDALANRPDSDYANSIAESIKAVESVARGRTGKRTLGNALKELGKDYPRVLTDGFEKLYGWTNNPDTGVRHALLDDPKHVGEAEARYFLVSCSAFAHYLLVKFGEAE